MNIWERMFGKKSKTHNVILQSGYNNPVWRTDNFQSFVREGYQQNIYVYACIRLLAMACAGIPWQVYERKGDGLELSPEHPLQLLIDKPNPQQGGSSLIEHLISNLYIYGDSYLEAVAPERSSPKELYILRPDRITIEPAQGLENNYIYKVGGNKTTFTSDEVLHFKLFNPIDDFYGQSPLKAGSRSIDLNNDSRAWNMALLQNGCRPPGILMTDENLTEEQKNSLRMSLQEGYTGPSQAGRTLLLEGGLTWQKAGLGPEEMDWKEGLEMTGREICIAFGVPPELIGDVKSATYSNYKEARAALYMETVMPVMDWTKYKLNSWLTPKFKDDVVLDYSKDAIEALQEDRELIWRRALDSFKTGILSTNETRAILGYNPVEGGDTLYMPLSLIPTATVERKSFNINGEEIKAAHWKSIDRARQSWISRCQKLVADEFEYERKEVDNFLKGGGKDLEEAFNPDRWLKLFRVIYVMVGGSFAQSTLEKLPGVKERKQEEDVWEKFIENYLKKNAAKKVKNILNTTMKSLQDILSKGEREGLGIFEIRKEIDKLYLEKIIPHRSEVIARTEIISASNMGSQAGAMASELPMEKEWLSTRDERTRDDHLEADGQTQDLDEPYEVGGEKFMFPGDSSLGASPENIIQCRCTETYKVKR